MRVFVLLNCVSASRSDYVSVLSMVSLDYSTHWLAPLNHVALNQMIGRQHAFV
jgi:hypothetical protein